MRLTDAHSLGDTYDRKLTDISRSKARSRKHRETLRARLTGSEKSFDREKADGDPEAYELYLKGRFFWNNAPVTDLKTAANYFQRAIDADPSYANAYAGLAESYLLIPLFGAGMPRDFFAQSQRRGRRAIELDEHLPKDTPHSRTCIAWTTSIRPRRKRNFSERSRWIPTTRPRITGSVQLLVPWPVLMKRSKKVTRRRAGSTFSHYQRGLGSTLMLSRHYDDAIAHYGLPSRSIQILPMPTGIWVKRFTSKVTRSAPSLSTKKPHRSDNDPEIQALLARAYAERQEGAGSGDLRKLSETAQQQFVRGYLFALIYIGLGDKTTLFNIWNAARRTVRTSILTGSG